MIFHFPISNIQRQKTPFLLWIEYSHARQLHKTKLIVSSLCFLVSISFISSLSNWVSTLHTFSSSFQFISYFLPYFRDLEPSSIHLYSPALFNYYFFLQLFITKCLQLHFSSSSSSLSFTSYFTLLAQVYQYFPFSFHSSMIINTHFILKVSTTYFLTSFFISF